MPSTPLLDTQSAMHSSNADSHSSDASLRLCADMISSLAGEKDATTLAQTLVCAIEKHLNAAATCCWLLDEKANVLLPTARSGCSMPFDGLNDAVPVGQTAIGEVAASRKPLIVSNLQQNPDLEIRQWAVREGIVSFVCLPIETTSKLFGVVAVFQRRELDETILFALNTVRKLVATEMERGQAGGETRRTNEFLQSFVHSAPTAVIALDRLQKVTLWNKEAERAFGWTRADVLGRRYAIVPVEGRETFDQWFAGILAGQRLKPMEATRQRADGTLIPVQVAMSPVYNEQNEIDGILEVLTDLTKQKHAERCLRTQLAVSNRLAEAETLADAAMRAIRAVCEILRWKCGELWLRSSKDKDFERLSFETLPGANCERFLSTICQNDSQPGQGILGRIVSASDNVWHADLSQLTDSPRAALARKDGLRTSIAVRIGNGEEVRGAILFFAEGEQEPDQSLRELLLNIGTQFEQLLERHDAKAALQTAEDQLRQSQKMDAIGLLAGGVAHDFNNILAVIIAYSEMGLDELEEDHTLREPLAEIHNAGQRAASLTRQLLAFSRKQVFEPTEVDLNKLAEDMDKMLRRLVGANITCESNLSRPLYRVKADAAQLEQVLLNLVVNARDAMPEGGRILVSTRNADLSADNMPPRVNVEPGSFAVLSVTDTGCGMDEATQARIFEPFFTTKAPGKGTGMGLSTVYGIVQQSGGFITVDSQVGKGTTFSVFFPRIKELLATQRVDDVLTELPAGSGMILVVENDDTVRTVVRRILELRGYSVIETRHGGEAVDVLKSREHTIDLIVTDIVMPVMDGLTLSKRVKTDYPQTKVLFMSGFAALPGETDGQLLEGGNFLQKPFTSDALIRKVHALLAN